MNLLTNRSIEFHFSVKYNRHYSGFLLRVDNSGSSFFYRLFGASCASCKEGIAPDQYVRKQDSRIFHIGCLKCQQCQKEAGTGDQLHVVGEGLYLCKKDFQQMKNAPKKIPRDGIYQVCYSYFLSIKLQTTK